MGRWLGVRRAPVWGNARPAARASPNQLLTAPTAQAGARPPLFLTPAPSVAADWYNVWQTAKLAGIDPSADYEPGKLQGITAEAAGLEAQEPRVVTRRLPVHVIFMDGHNASPMDSGWRGLFWSINYAKHFTGPVLFRRAFISPFGCVRAGCASAAKVVADSACSLVFGPRRSVLSRVSNAGADAAAASLSHLRCVAHTQSPFIHV